MKPSILNRVEEGSLYGRDTIALLRSCPVASTSLNSPGDIGSLSPTILTPFALNPPGKFAN